MTGRGLTKLHKLPAGPTLYTNQIPEKEVKPSILRRQVTGDPMARKLFSSKKEVTFRSGWTHGVSISENVKSKLEPHQKKSVASYRNSKSQTTRCCDNKKRVQCSPISISK